MGFRKDAYATCWEVQPKSDVCTTVRLSTSKKNKTTGEYETDFSGFVSFVGTNAAKKAANLKEKDRIKIGDCDVSTYFDRESGKSYTNFKVFDFEPSSTKQSNPVTSAEQEAITKVEENVEEGLPF